MPRSKDRRVFSRSRFFTSDARVGATIRSVRQAGLRERGLTTAGSSIFFGSAHMRRKTSPT